MDEVPSKKIRLGDNTLNNINDIEVQEASDCQENVLKSSGENHTLSSSKICDNCSEEAASRNEKRLVSLGNSDYDALSGCIDFIDKSLFAWHFYHDPDSPLLVTASSRFGKTSILKMLERFFGIPITSSGVRITNVI